jgi:drug/metabolite transporter (DMT)-like permease
MVESGQSGPSGQSVLPALALTFNALVFGVSWWPFRALQAHGLHPLWATAFIFIFSVICILAVSPHGWRDFLRQPLLFLLLLSSGLTNVGFNWAVTIGDVVRVVLLFYLMPAWAILLAWPLLGEKPTAGSLLRLGLALTGVVIVLKTADSPWPLPESLADLLALLGGFCFAMTNILLRKLNQTQESSRMLAMFGGGAIMSVLVASLGMYGGLVNAPPAPALDWLVIALGIGVAFLASNLALQYGAARLSASATSLIMLTEVIFASVSASLLGAGEITLRLLAGGSLILLASLLSVVNFKPARSA